MQVKLNQEVIQRMLGYYKKTTRGTQAVSMLEKALDLGFEVYSSTAADNARDYPQGILGFKKGDYLVRDLYKYTVVNFYPHEATNSFGDADRIHGKELAKFSSLELGLEYVNQSILQGETEAFTPAVCRFTWGMTPIIGKLINHDH